MNSPSPAMTMTSKHAAYEMEENYATIVERFRCHLTEEQGLVWCGLPSMSPIQWEPSTTVIKVTNTHTHTHTHSKSVSCIVGSQSLLLYLHNLLKSHQLGIAESLFQSARRLLTQFQKSSKCLRHEISMLLSRYKT